LNIRKIKVLLDCFIVNKSKDFESFLHKEIKEHKVNYLENHITENELFLIGKKLSYNSVLHIINNNIKYFNDNNMDLEKAELEIIKLKQMNEIITNNNFVEIFQQVLNTNKNTLHEINELKKINIELLEKVNSLQTNTKNNFNEDLKTMGPRLQKINPEKYMKL